MTLLAANPVFSVATSNPGIPTPARHVSRRSCRTNGQDWNSQPLILVRIEPLVQTHVPPA
jgi:hypothetical protein